MREILYRAIATALSELGVPDANFVVEQPGDLSHGDYATNAALVAAKILKKSPKEVAEALKEKFSKENGLAERSEEIRGPFRKKTFLEGVEKIETAGPGFINFFLSHEAIAGEVGKMAHGEFGEIKSDLKGQVVMVEYTDPNPFKEFHIGHLMSNTIGESIARLFEAVGAHVSRANYQGDVGLHVAKAIWGKQQKPTASWGEAYVFGSEQYEAHKAEVDALNKIIYEKTDPTVNTLYDEGRAESLERFEKIYAMLGTTFNHYFFESELAASGAALVRAHVGSVFEESDGALVYKGEKAGLHTRVFVNSLGLPTYEAKELALAFAKEEKQKSDLLVVVTANEINEYFKVVLSALGEINPALAAKIQHVGHGFLKLTTGKMSSRKGNVITGESLLADLKDAAKEKMEGRELEGADKVAEQVAVGAIKYAVLKQGSGRDIVFDPEKSLSLQGDSGPYLQYARVRALSLIKSAELIKDFKEENSIPDKGFAESDHTPEARIVLERTLIHFAEVVERAAQELEPHYVTTYLTELASAFNSWYMSERVIGSNRVAEGLLLARAVEQTLTKGLSLLGIPAPEKM